MGNPHAIYYVDQVDCLDLERIGPAFENHERFAPDRVNTEFIHVADRKHLEMRVWGAGKRRNLGVRHRRHGQCHGLPSSWDIRRMRRRWLCAEENW